MFIIQASKRQLEEKVNMVVYVVEYPILRIAQGPLV